MRKRYLATVSAIGCILPFAPVHGQSQVPSQQADNLSAEEGLEAGDIIVTGERRATTAQYTPISIVGFSGKELEDRHISSAADLQFAVPSLTYQDTGNVKFLNIRGIGIADTSPNKMPGVAVHLDGAYMASGSTYGDAFFDLESIEVLRGPQGTYSGQYANGGAIFINSVAPRIGEASGFASAEIGTFGKKKFGLGVNVPVSDSLALRVSGEGEKRGSYYTNYGPFPAAGVKDDNQPGNLSRYMIRAQALFEPSNDMSLRLIFQTSDSSSDNMAIKREGLDPDLGERELAYDFDSLLNIQYWRATANFDWNISKNVLLKANASYHHGKQRWFAENDLTNSTTHPEIAQDAVRFFMDDKYYSAEVDLLSQNTGKFEWSLGVTALVLDQGNLIEPSVLYGPGSGPDFTSGIAIRYDPMRRSYAAFGEVGYQFTPSFEMKVGMRYTTDRSGQGPLSGIYFDRASSEPGVSTARPFVKHDAVTGRVVANFTPGEGTLLYASLARGYKPGGASSLTNIYNNEYVFNYEGGWKQSFFGNRLRSAVSAFYMQYKDYQASFDDDPTDMLPGQSYNIDGTHLKGVDISLNGKFGGFRFDASTTLLKSKTGHQNIAFPANLYGPGDPLAPIVVDVHGRSLPNSPSSAASASVGYAFPLEGGELTPTVRLAHQSKQWTTFYQAPNHLLEGRTLVNAQLMYTSDANWMAEAFVTNLFDVDYRATLYNYTDGGGYRFGLGAPREIGVRFRANF